MSRKAEIDVNIYYYGALDPDHWQSFNNLDDAIAFAKRKRYEYKQRDDAELYTITIDIPVI